MRIKTLLAVAALTAAGLATSMAQNVYSLNVVGYYNVTVPAGKYALIANQLVQTNSTVANVLASVPAGTTVLKWTGTGFAPNTYNGPDIGWDDPTMTVQPGEGFFIQNTTTSDFTVTFVGEVDQNSETIQLTAGKYSLVSLFTPQQGDIQADFGYTPNDGDTILPWSGSSYSPDSYAAGIGWDYPPVVHVGDGFFIKPAKDNTWTRQFTVQ